MGTSCQQGREEGRQLGEAARVWAARSRRVSADEQAYGGAWPGWDCAGVVPGMRGGQPGLLGWMETAP